MTTTQISALEVALQIAVAAIKAQYGGDFIVGVCFAPTTTAPSTGHDYPTSLSIGFGQFAQATLKAIPAGVEPVEITPLDMPLAHAKENQQ